MNTNTATNRALKSSLYFRSFRGDDNEVGAGLGQHVNRCGAKHIRADKKATRRADRRLNKVIARVES